VISSRGASDRRRSRSTVGHDRGFVATEWVIGVALLVLPFLLLSAVLPTWAAQREAAASAAREAARVAVQAGDDPAAAALGEAAGLAALAGRGVDGAVVRVLLPARLPGGAPPREGVVEAVVTVPGRSVRLPGFGPVEGPTVEGRHARALDAYRSR
jgi:hypothetical protein